MTRVCYTKMVCWGTLGVVLVLASVASAFADCQTLLTEILVTKEKTYEYNGRRIRLVCAGNVMVNKCEGACTSEVSPSVVQFPGFKKVRQRHQLTLICPASIVISHKS